MLNTFTDKIFTAFDGFCRGMCDWLGKTVDHNCMIETADIAALSANNGSLMTLMDYQGAISQIGEEEFDRIVTGLNTQLSSVFSKPGRMLQIAYHYDPNQIDAEVERILKPSMRTAKNIQLSIEEIIKDQADTVSQYCAVERCFMAVWTKPKVLPPTERKRAMKKRDKRSTQIPTAMDKQSVMSVLKEIRHEHEGLVSLLIRSFKDHGLVLRPYGNHEALWWLRRLTCPEFTSSNWRALLPGDPIPKIYPDSGRPDYYGLLYPSIASQLFPREGEAIDRVTVKIGDILHRPLIVTLPAQHPKPFQVLFRHLTEKKIPYRMIMNIEPEGLAGLSFKSILATLLAFTASDNKRFNDAVAALREASLHGVTDVKLSFVFDTWVRTSGDVDAEDLDKLGSQASILAGAIQAWGTCDVTESVGDPLLGVCASIPGLMDRSPAPQAAAPLIDVIKMIPMRPVSIWSDGSFLLRTPDGKPMPYSPLSSKQASWNEIGAAPMGAGKSVFLSSLNFAFILQAGLDEMPWVSNLDIGPSSSGLIALIKESVPLNMRHMAAYHRIRMEPRFAVNPFDTPLGCRKVLPNQISFLVNLLSLFATPMDKTAPGEGIPGLARMSVERCYNLLSDEITPKIYTPNTDDDVSEMVAKLNLRVDKDTTWWEIVDALFDAGYPHKAARAQRYAVPLLSDIISVCHQSKDIRQLYGDEKINSFCRSLAEAIQAYPILKEPTRFDISDTRIVSLDLDEVAPRGGAVADRQTAVMYMIGRHIVASKFFVMPEDVRSMPVRYREYQSENIEKIRRAAKRFTCDEVHRVTKNEAVVNQFVGDLETAGREARKWNLSIGLYSQHFDDVPEILRELATTVIVLGVGTIKAANKICEDFGFNDLMKHTMQNLGKPDGRGANFVALFKTSHGNLYLTLTNTISKLALWAFSSTSEDRTVRDALYETIGVKKTLKVLAKYWPGGVKQEVERRKLLFEEKGFDQMTKNVEEQLIEELLKLAERQV